MQTIWSALFLRLGDASVNQIEIHPDFYARELVSASRERGIVVQAWSPLGQGGALLTDPIFTRIAEKHGKTPAQAIALAHPAGLRRDAAFAEF